MARYTQQSRDRVRDAVNFVELVSARTELRRTGAARYEGLCPFHDERTPSFGIDPAQKVYYCFGCQAAGDVFTFVQETEGVDFTGALEILAQRAGVELEPERENPRDADVRRRRERLFELLARTAAYYVRMLWESEEAAGARDYLAGRGLGKQALLDYAVGYAPEAWDRVLSASLRGGFGEQELLAAGVVQRSADRRRLFDRFRGRIMFPLADMRGRVLGFGARKLEGAKEGGDGGEGAQEQERRQGPKYLNTAENEIYHKGHHLYGAHLARAHAAREGRVVLCEGYTDVIAMHQAGIANAVGLMGTALTERQLTELARMAQTVLLALDADTAGQEAMLKAQRLAGRHKIELRVVQMPGGMDPAELIQREGAEAMRAAIESSLPFMRFRVDRVLAGGDPSNAEWRDRAIEALRPLFAQVPPSALRLELAQAVAGRLALPESLLERLLRDGGTSPAPAQRSPTRLGSGDGTALGGRRLAERGFLALCISNPRVGSAALGRLELEEHFAEESMRRAAAHLHAGHLQEPMAGVNGEESEELRRTLAELVVEAGREPAGEAMLAVSELQLRLAALERRIQAARGVGGEVAELARRRIELKQELDAAQERALGESMA